jgi:hypothetical protein
MSVFSLCQVDYVHYVITIRPPSNAVTVPKGPIYHGVSCITSTPDQNTGYIVRFPPHVMRLTVSQWST